MVEAAAHLTWVLLAVAIRAIATVCGGNAMVARQMLGPPLASDDIDWRYYTEDSPDPHRGPRGYWRNDIGGKWEESWVYRRRRRVREIIRSSYFTGEPQPPRTRQSLARPSDGQLPPGHGPRLLQVELAWEHVVTALPLMASVPAPGVDTDDDGRRRRGSKDRRREPTGRRRGRPHHAMRAPILVHAKRLYAKGKTGKLSQDLDAFAKARLKHLGKAPHPDAVREWLADEEVRAWLANGADAGPPPD